MSIDKLKRKILEVIKRYPVTRAGIFGSVARGRSNRKSDVDVVVEFKQGVGLLELVDLKLNVEKALGRKVDLVEYQTLKPRLRKRILAEEVSIL